jgi:hypothetical protein
MAQARCVPRAKSAVIDVLSLVRSCCLQPSDQYSLADGHRIGAQRQCLGGIGAERMPPRQSAVPACHVEIFGASAACAGGQRQFQHAR